MLAHVFIGNASRLSLSFDSRVEARTTLCSRAPYCVSFSKEKSRWKIRKRAFKEVGQIDNSEWFSKDRESASVQSASIFTLQVCLHWPDKRYLPIIIARLDFACAFSFDPFSPLEDHHARCTRLPGSSNFNDSYRCTRSVSWYNSVISYKFRWIRRPTHSNRF